MSAQDQVLVVDEVDEIRLRLAEIDDEIRALQRGYNAALPNEPEQLAAEEDWYRLTAERDDLLHELAQAASTENEGPGPVLTAGDDPLEAA